MKVLTAVLLTCVVASLALLHSVYGTPVPTPIPANATETKAPPPNDEPLVVEASTINLLGNSPSLEVPQMEVNDQNVAARSVFNPIVVPLSGNAEPPAVAAVAAGEQIPLQANLDYLIPDEPAEPIAA
ncbi:uncharacterized protein LOC135439104 [Drosophila montana]|uniref:uncharacterized protein LOC135439104 n=1 Tax=Drosophila montana TaxID=40370 RepID=UPI00313A907B